MAGSSTHGIEWAMFGLIDTSTGKLITGADKGLSETGLYQTGKNVEGTTAVNIQNLEAAGTAQYADNKLMRVTKPAQSPTADFTFLDMDWEVLNKLLGYGTTSTSADGGYSLATDKPHLAWIAASTDYKGNTVYESFANCTAIDPTHSHQTDDASEQDVSATLNTTAYSPIGDNFKNAQGKSMPYRKWNSNAKNFDFDKMMAEVFPGYVKSSGMTVSTGDH